MLCDDDANAAASYLVEVDKCGGYAYQCLLRIEDALVLWRFLWHVETLRRVKRMRIAARRRFR